MAKWLGSNDHYVFALTTMILSVLVASNFGLSTPRRITKRSAVLRTIAGAIRGYEQFTAFEHRPYYAFKGIPFAEPPIGKLRFMAPVPIKKWRGIRDGSKHGAKCVQYWPNTETAGEEDCLYLNVYTPSVRPRTPELPPIMVYLHSGSFFRGSGDDNPQGPDFLINENVVLVTVNYRVGVLGFLALNSTRHSGNAGLKDQQMALQWVHDNAVAIGGDQNRVTLFGASSGSYSSQFHILSDVSNKLIHRVIFLSNTFDVWSMFNQTRLTDDVLADYVSEKTQIAKDQVTFDDTLNVLQTVSPYELLDRFSGGRYQRYVYLRIEDENDDQPLITGTIDQVTLKSNFSTNIDVMSGYCSNEAISIMGWKSFRRFLDDSQINFPNVRFSGQFSHADYPKAIAEIFSRYFPNGLADNQQTYEQYITLSSDTTQNYFIDERIQRLAAGSKANTYFYRFDMVTQLNYPKSIYQDGDLPGACHGDELCYIFYCAKAASLYTNVTTSTREYELIKLMAGMYADFARYGNPLPNGYWPVVRPDQQNVMEINTYGLRILDDPLKNVRTFWSNLMSKYSQLSSN